MLSPVLTRIGVNHKLSGRTHMFKGTSASARRSGIGLKAGRRKSAELIHHKKWGSPSAPAGLIQRFRGSEKTILHYRRCATFTSSFPGWRGKASAGTWSYCIPGLFPMLYFNMNSLKIAWKISSKVTSGHCPSFPWLLKMCNMFSPINLFTSIEPDQPDAATPIYLWIWEYPCPPCPLR